MFGHCFCFQPPSFDLDIGDPLCSVTSFCPFFTNHICINALLLSYRTIYPAPSVFQICFLSRWDFVGWRIDRYLFSHFSQWCTSSFTEKGKQGSPILHIHIQIWSSGTQVMLLLSKTSISFQTKYCQKKLHLRIFSLRSLHHKKCAICNIVDSQLNCIDYH